MDREIDPNIISTLHVECEVLENISDDNTSSDSPQPTGVPPYKQNLSTSDVAYSVNTPQANYRQFSDTTPLGYNSPKY